MPINIDTIACLPNCTPQTLPLMPACLDELKGWRGRILDLSFIPCDEEITDSNLLDISSGGWWDRLVQAPTPKLRKFGMGVGSYAQANG